MKTCGEVLLELISNYGIDTAFGIPGVTTVPLYKTMDKINIRHIAPRHEQGCVMMADGYARSSGKPAACILVTGPGLCNGVTGMIQAMQECSPMLVITATTTLRHISMPIGELHQSQDQAAIGKASAVQSHTIVDPRQLPSVMAQAFTVFRSSKPGPVHIQIPLDIIYSNADGVDTTPWAIADKYVPNINSLTEAVELLKSAKNPLILAGGGAKDASKEILTFIEALDLPLMNTTNSKGIIPSTHPLACNGSASLRPFRNAINEADVVFAIGTELGETDYNTVGVGDFTYKGKLIRLDIDPVMTSSIIRPHLSLIGDARLALIEMNKQLKGVKLNKKGAERAAHLREELKNDRYSNPDITAFFEAVKSTSDNLIIVGDSNLATHHAVWQLSMDKPRTYFHGASGFGTLGLSIPASFGVKLASPKNDVVAIIGDGSFQFTSPELITAVQEKICTAIVVWNNEKYQEIKNYMIATGTPTIGVDPMSPNFVDFAKSLHCHSMEVHNLEELKAELKNAYKKDRPTVIVVHEKNIVNQKTSSGTWYSDTRKKSY